MISKAIRNSARGRDCTLRLPGCHPRNETVVFCHAPGIGMKGMGAKVPDLFGFWACHKCHARVDQHLSGWDYQDILRAMCETQLALYDMGIITIKS